MPARYPVSLPQFFSEQVSLLSMPTMVVTGDFYRDTQILAADLDRFVLHIKSFREPLNRAIREVMIPSIKKNFDSEGRPAWRQLSYTTVSARRSAHPILQVTRTLRRRATQVNIWRVDTNSAGIEKLDSMVKYAKYHQAGTSRMVARPFAMIQQEDEEAIEQVFYQWLVERSYRYGRFR